MESACYKFGFQFAEHVLELTRSIVGELGIHLNGGVIFCPLDARRELYFFIASRWHSLHTYCKPSAWPACFENSDSGSSRPHLLHFLVFSSIVFMIWLVSTGMAPWLVRTEYNRDIRRNLCYYPSIPRISSVLISLSPSKDLYILYSHKSES